MKGLLTRTFLLAAVAALSSSGRAHAQSNPASVALHVAGLTTEERDRLNADLTRRGDLRISFACVPAGILILEAANDDRSVDSVRAQAAAAIIRHLPAQRRTEVAMSLDEAEALCASARDH